MTTENPARPVPRDIFEGGGEAGALLRGIDWDKTLLGPPARWPRTLRTLIPPMLASSFGMRILWGPQMVMLYNDGYRPVLGASKHPAAMGRPIEDSYHELWHIVGPLFHRVYAGETVTFDDSFLPLHRYGYLEECFFTLSYSPLRGDTDQIEGLLGVVHETTLQVLTKRRLVTLRALAAYAATSSAESAEAVAQRALETLTSNPADVPFALFYLDAGAGRDRRLTASSRVASQSDEDLPWPFAEARISGKATVVKLDDGRFGALSGGVWPEPAREAVLMPLSRQGFTGFLVIGLSPRRAYDASYADFCALAAESVAVAVERRIGDEERTQLLAREQEALAEVQVQRSRLAKVFEQAPVAICMLRGREQLFEFANPRYCELVARDPSGKKIREAFPDLAGQGIYELLDNVLSTGEPFYGNEVAITLVRSGRPEECCFNFTYQAVDGAHGEAEGVLVVAVEVTELVRARQRAELLARDLERSNKELDQFAYVASHDLKAPLRGIVNLSTWLEEDLGPVLTPSTAEQLKLLRGRVRRMEALIDGVLDYSRAGRVRHVPEPVDTGRLVTEVVEMLSPKGAARVEVARPMPVLKTERVPLQQVFLNLVSNALKHGKRDDVRVRVEVRDEGKFFAFSVADNGPGIAAEFHERIWIIFQTLEARDKVEGTGIGLSVVQKTVESRGGRAWVESQPGQGATFYFTWPKNEPQAMTPQRNP